MESCKTVIPETKIFVLDGGALLQKKAWKKGETFQEICQRYVDYVIQNYGQNAKVVFDGYPDEPTTKDTAHFRRSKGKRGVRVRFTLNSKLSMLKETFLLNKENKQGFNEWLTSNMNSCNIAAFQAYDDADTLEVMTAIDAAISTNVVVIGEDTDILVLLLHYYRLDYNNSIFFMSDKNIKGKKIWDIREVKKNLPQEIVECILPIHAFS